MHRQVLLVLIAAGLPGCLGPGAGSISRDRFDPRRVSEEQWRLVAGAAQCGGARRRRRRLLSA